jgi:hypothetical protein
VAAVGRGPRGAGRGDESTWPAFGKGHRRQGVNSAAVGGALDLIRDLGGGTVEGYPEDAADVAAGFLYHGALSTYDKLGFTRDREVGKHRWVVSRRVRGRRA